MQEKTKTFVFGVFAIVSSTLMRHHLALQGHYQVVIRLKNKQVQVVQLSNSNMNTYLALLGRPSTPTTPVPFVCVVIMYISSQSIENNFALHCTLEKARFGPTQSASSNKIGPYCRKRHDHVTGGNLRREVSLVLSIPVQPSCAILPIHASVLASLHTAH